MKKSYEIKKLDNFAKQFDDIYYLRKSSDFFKEWKKSYEIKKLGQEMRT